MLELGGGILGYHMLRVQYKGEQGQTKDGHAVLSRDRSWVLLKLFHGIHVRRIYQKYIKTLGILGIM